MVGLPTLCCQFDGLGTLPKPQEPIPSAAVPREFDVVYVGALISNVVERTTGLL
jgi:hypothetical protein